jgi:hypothetical protein
MSRNNHKTKQKTLVRSIDQVFKQSPTKNT